MDVLDLYRSIRSGLGKVGFALPFIAILMAGIEPTKLLPETESNTWFKISVLLFLVWLVVGFITKVQMSNDDEPIWGLTAFSLVLMTVIQLMGSLWPHTSYPDTWLANLFGFTTSLLLWGWVVIDVFEIALANRYVEWRELLKPKSD